MRAYLATPLALLLCPGLSAQTTTLTSPAAVTTVDGASNSAFPFTATSNRFQQTITDFKGSPRLFKSVALRPDQGYSCPNCVTRTVEVQITMAHTDITKTTTTFASNYIGTPVVVFPRQKVTLPTRKGPYGSVPAPDFTFIFKTPFPYDGKQDFLVDIQTWNASPSGTGNEYYGDYASTRTYAQRVSIGTGCTATGKSAAMSIGSYCSSQPDSNNNASHRFYWYGANAVDNGAGLIIAGVKNPNLTVPGLCTNLYADFVLLFPVTFDAAGAYSLVIYAPFEPGWVGATVYAQAMAIDTGRTGIPLSLSNGVSSKFYGYHGFARRLQHFSDGSATTGALYTNQLVFVFGT